MTVRIYTKQDKVKNIEADIPILEYLILRDALTDYCKSTAYNETEKEMAIQMLLDMDPETAELITIESLA